MPQPSNPGNGNANGNATGNNGKAPRLKPIAQATHGGFQIIPVSYVRYSSNVLIQYTDGPNAGTQKTVPWTQIVHPGGEEELVRVLRSIRIDA